MLTINRTNINKEFFTANIFTLGVNDIFKFDSSLDFGTVVHAIISFKKELDIFDVLYVPPGSKLYATYGVSTIVVIKKQIS